ncbi:site-specific integrase [Nesterenkonia pannonica]|uniref:site-specific integrase n=1 Tax=Nesterenkonia pannonica TaxID=1548602 RepID=UPI0021640F36|nr:site-specific integrase [Nesterenkonia pannonica]
MAQADSAGDPLLEEFAAHIQHERGLSANTLRSYLSDLTQLADSCGPFDSSPSDRCAPGSQSCTRPVSPAAH